MIIVGTAISLSYEHVIIIVGTSICMSYEHAGTCISLSYKYVMISVALLSVFDIGML